MRSLMVFLPVALTLLFVQSGSAFYIDPFMPFGRFDRFGINFDRLEHPKYRPIKAMCNALSNGDQGIEDLRSYLETVCDNNGAFQPHLEALLKMVTTHSTAAKFFNKNE